jgi:hypothetical protein
MSNNFHFIRPELLWLALMLIFALILKKIIYLFVLKNKSLNSSATNWTKICNPKILEFLYFKKNNINKKSNHYLIYLISLLLIIALAGPTWSKKRNTVI